MLNSFRRPNIYTNNIRSDYGERICYKHTYVSSDHHAIKKLEVYFILF